MRYGRKASTVAATVLAMTLTACGSDERVEGVDVPTEEEIAAAELSPEALEALKRKYPVLREEPAPEPRPSGDASAGVPDSLVDRLPEKVLQTVHGGASFYADRFEGRRTASGIPFRQNQLVAAHRSFPFGTLLRVTNLATERAVNVRVVDRGPFGAADRILDLSRRAARELGYESAGQARVRVEVLEWGPGLEGAI